jgi:hypothetical protein
VTASYHTLREADLAALFERARADYDVVAKTRDVNGELRYGRPASFDQLEFVEQQPPVSAK